MNYSGFNSGTIYIDDIFSFTMKATWEEYLEKLENLISNSRYVNGTQVTLDLNSIEGRKYIKLLQKQYHIKFYLSVEDLANRTYTIFTTSHTSQDFYTCISGVIYFPNVPKSLINNPRVYII